MRDTHNTIAEKTRDIIAPVSDYSLFLCHDGSGTALVDSSPASQQLLGDITINGTTAGIWAKEGNFTPAGDHAQQKNSVAQLVHGDLTAYSGQLIFFMDIYATGAPSTNFNTILMYGNSSGANMLRFTIETTGRFQVQTKDSAGITKSSNTVTYGSVCDSVKHSLMAVIDPINGTQITYVDGVAQGNTAIDTDNLPSSHTRGWGMLANITSDAPAFNTELGSEGIAGLYINRIGLMKTTADQSSNLGDIAKGLNAIAHELPWAMDGA